MEKNKSQKELEDGNVRNRKMSYTEKKKIVKEDKRKNAESKRPVSERKRRKKTRRKISTRATILAVIGLLGIGGVGGYALGTHNSKIPGITDGKEAIKIDMNEVEKDVEIDNVLQQNQHGIFVKKIQDAALNGEVENTDSLEQEPTEEEKIAEEIKGLDSAEEIDAYLANMYIEAYEQQTGDKELNTSDIRISQNYESYVYVLDDGKIVSHGDFPYETEKQMEADGKSYDEVRRDVKICIVKLIKTGETIDEMTTKLERVIPGENYTNMKDYDSVLVDMGEIIQKAFRLKELLKELESNPGNEYIEGVYENTLEELVEAVIEYYKGKTTPTNEENQIQESAEDEMEL